MRDDFRSKRALGRPAAFLKSAPVSNLGNTLNKQLCTKLLFNVTVEILSTGAENLMTDLNLFTCISKQAGNWGKTTN